MLVVDILLDKLVIRMVFTEGKVEIEGVHLVEEGEHPHFIHIITLLHSIKIIKKHQ